MIIFRHLVLIIYAKFLWMTCPSETCQRSPTRIRGVKLPLTTQKLAHHVVPYLNVEVFVPPMAKVQCWNLSWLITLFYKFCPGDQPERFLEEHH